MIVDDDQLNIEATSELIKQFNLTSAYVTNGQDAIQMIRKRLDSSVQGGDRMFKLILCDYSMPDMDGF